MWCWIGWHKWTRWEENPWYALMGRDGLHLLNRKCENCKIEQSGIYSEHSNKITRKSVKK